MNDRNYLPGEAAAKLGITSKALRIYEARGLISPLRSLSGWRLYDARQMSKAAGIVRLRRLGLSLADIMKIDGGKEPLEQALTEQLGRVDQRSRELAELRRQIAAPLTQALASCDTGHARPPAACFPLPWPWQGEPFSFDPPARLTFVVGPVGSGKTRFCQALAAALPNGVLIDLERSAGLALAADDEMISQRIDRLESHGATVSVALTRLVRALEATRRRPAVVDLVEAELDGPTQHAVMHELHAHDHGAPLVLMTRSSAILDLSSSTQGDAIILCPANHNPPVFVSPYRGAPGFETLESCLATPEARARLTRASAASPPAA